MKTFRELVEKTTKYEDLPEDIKSELEDIAKTDPYGLNPKTLYTNIIGSLKHSSVKSVQKIMEIPISLITKIDKLNR